MTEDAAVFGGLNNMLEGLENTYALYKPKMIAVSTTCMAEVIGDDLNAYIKTAREKGVIPQDLRAFAHTPSFVGSHIVGYDNMLKGILKALTEGKKGESNGKINIIPGFDTYTGNYHEIKRLMSMMGVEFTLLADVSDTFDSPNTGEYKLYPGAPRSLRPGCRKRCGNSCTSERHDKQDAGPYPKKIGDKKLSL